MFTRQSTIRAACEQYYKQQNTGRTTPYLTAEFWDAGLSVLSLISDLFQLTEWGKSVGNVLDKFLLAFRRIVLNEQDINAALKVKLTTLQAAPKDAPVPERLQGQIEMLTELLRQQKHSSN